MSIKSTLIAVLIILSSFNLYSRNYKRSITGVWKEYEKNRPITLVFKRNNVVIKYRYRRYKISGTYKIEDNYLILKFGKKTLIYMIMDMTRSVINVKKFNKKRQAEEQYYYRVK